MMNNNTIKCFRCNKLAILMLHNRKGYLPVCQEHYRRIKAERFAKLKAKQEEIMENNKLNFGIEGEGTLTTWKNLE